MELGLRGRVALVAAAGAGLGFATARALAFEGVRVALFSRTPETIERAAKRIADECRDRARVDRGIGETRPTRDSDPDSVPAILPLVADVTDPEAVASVVARTAEHFGALHILVPNSGGPPPGTFESLSPEQWEAGHACTFGAVVPMIRAGLPWLKAAGWGRIVVITSTSVRQPIPGLVLSNAYRAGIVGLVRTLSREFAPYGITVNNVGPGSFATDRLERLFLRQSQDRNLPLETIRSQQLASIPLGRLGDPAELGELVAFIASDRAAYLTGQTILLDGGLTGGQ